MSALRMGPWKAGPGVSPAAAMSVDAEVAAIRRLTRAAAPHLVLMGDDAGWLAEEIARTLAMVLRDTTLPVLTTMRNADLARVWSSGIS